MCGTYRPRKWNFAKKFKGYSLSPKNLLMQNIKWDRKSENHKEGREPTSLGCAMSSIYKSYREDHFNMMNRTWTIWSASWRFLVSSQWAQSVAPSYTNVAEYPEHEINTALQSLTDLAPNRTSTDPGPCTNDRQRPTSSPLLSQERGFQSYVKREYWNVNKSDLSQGGALNSQHSDLTHKSFWRRRKNSNWAIP